MSSLLILTVGTGITGPAHSDVSAGLARTVNLTQPRLYWLVPSQSEKSLPVADMIREQVTGTAKFVAWSATARYHAIPDPDDIHGCRRVLGEVIRAAKEQLRPGERLVINPTGGTKQMSAGATLAALDEEAGELMFTTGEREDGVVKTGTEKPRSLSTEMFFLERDLRIAESLFACGSFYGAARVIRKYAQPEAVRARHIALCLHDWQRLHYSKAAENARTFSAELAAHLKGLSESNPFSSTRLGDLLAGGDELLSWGDYEEALARYYRGAEQAAKVRFSDSYNIRPVNEGYSLEELEKISPRLAGEMRSQTRSGRVYLTAQRAWDFLEAAQDPMALAYAKDHKLSEGLKRRNASLYGHGDLPVAAQDVVLVGDRLRNLLGEHLPTVKAAWTTRHRPHSLL